MSGASLYRDIETSGLDDDAVVTVAGFAHELETTVILNVAGRERPDREQLAATLETNTEHPVHVRTADDEAALLAAVATFATQQLDGDRHYLTAYNGETWNGGFDLPFCRTRFSEHDMDWSVGDVAYADMMTVVDRFDPTTSVTSVASTRRWSAVKRVTPSRTAALPSQPSRQATGCHCWSATWRISSEPAS